MSLIYRISLLRPRRLGWTLITQEVHSQGSWSQISKNQVPCNLWKNRLSHISTENIGDCHHISEKSNKIMVKFSKRKDYQQVLLVKNDLRSLNIKENCPSEGNKIFVNRSLCICFRILLSQSKKLKSIGKIYRFDMQTINSYLSKCKCTSKILFSILIV